MNPVVYYPPTDAVNEVTRLYSVDKFLLFAEWEERTSARHEAFWSTRSDPYTYGKGVGVRTYYPKAFPDWMAALQKSVNALAGREMQLCFLNRYDNEKQHLGWHADDSPEQDDNAPIIVQSFGAEREFWWREYGSSGADAIYKQLCENQSTLVMLPGMQQTHQHRIPKHDRPCGVRISLTWRALKD